jgi:capsular polysaccharide transport system ATP-binding protein
MIQLEGVSKSYRTQHGRRVVLRNVTLRMSPGRSIGVLGANGAGKSTLIRLLAGVERPDTGRIRRAGRVSFPLGFSGTFHDHLTGRENVLFLARIYGADPRRTLRFVQEFAELGEYMAMKLRTYSAGMRAKLAFGTCLAIDFDVYLIDEVTAVGDARFQQRCREAFDQRVGAADIVMVTHSTATMRGYCDAGGVLANGELRLFDALEDALAAHTAAMLHAPEPVLEPA